MGDISTEQKLQLTRQVRERYRQDRQDLGQREQVLYGRPLSYFEEDDQMSCYGRSDHFDAAYDDMGNGAAGRRNGTLGLRILLAAVLVCLLVLLDRRGDTLFGLTSGQILEYIRYDCMPQP